MSGVYRVQSTAGIIDTPSHVKPADTSVTALVTSTACFVDRVTVAAGTTGATANLFHYDGTTEWPIGAKAVGANGEHQFAACGFRMLETHELRVKSSLGNELTFSAYIVTGEE